MAARSATDDIRLQDRHPQNQETTKDKETRQRRWKTLLGNRNRDQDSSDASTDGLEEDKIRPAKWSFGILNDKLTEEVPGTLQLRKELTASCRHCPQKLRGCQCTAKNFFRSAMQTSSLARRILLLTLGEIMED